MYPVSIYKVQPAGQAEQLFILPAGNRVWRTFYNRSKIHDQINIRLNIIGHSLVVKMEKDIRNFESLVENLSDKEIKQLNLLLNKIRKHWKINTKQDISI